MEQNYEGPMNYDYSQPVTAKEKLAAKRWRKEYELGKRKLREKFLKDLKEDGDEPSE